jgi:aldehyde dehydrogenase (NAD+)
VEAKSKKFITVTNPATEEIVCDNVHLAGADDVDAAVDAATAAFYTGPWSKYTAKQRAECLYKVSDLVLKYRQELAEAEVVAMGSPIGVEMWIIQLMSDMFKCKSTNCQNIVSIDVNSFSFFIRLCRLGRQDPWRAIPSRRWHV